jgi:[methyl-Co(III) methanol-specific corrinoid protein]:coenzyme M methyltransferase
MCPLKRQKYINDLRKKNLKRIKMADELSSKERVLKLLNGERIDRVPCFSGMGNVTLEGLNKYGIKFSDAHQDSTKMALSAASSYELYGYESAVVPFDLGMEAEALGCEINYYEHKEDGIIYPTIKTKVLTIDEEVSFPKDFLERGRIPLISEAIKKLNERVDGEVCIGSYVLGPFTLAGQLMDLNELLKMSFKRQEDISNILDSLTEPIIELANHLRRAGADFITVREMGAPSDIISPRMFKTLIMPPLKKVIDGLSAPRILHMCGNTNPIVGMMYECGADAISVEQKNDVAATRAQLGDDAVILGDIDAYNTLVKGTPADVRKAVKNAIDAGVNGVMPGCDIWPEVPGENMKAMVKATIEFGKIS